MDTEEVKTGKPLIIANPIYDTVFKRLMENQRVAKFILGAIIERQVEELTVMPQESTYKLDLTKPRNKEKDGDEDKERAGSHEYYRICRLDFMATVRTDEGKLSKILIEVQKTWHTADVIRFRKYLGQQYVREDITDGEPTTLPVTTIYILGKNLPEIDCPCVKVGRTYVDMRDKRPIDAKSEFIENLTHDSYVIQANRITDVRYVTNLDKLLSIFEQKYFAREGSEVIKRYHYHPKDENMKLITEILHEMGVDPDESKLIEEEEESLRYINNYINGEQAPLKKTLKEKDKTIAEQAKSLEGKDKTIAEQAKSLEGKDKEIEKLKRLLREKQ
jgi:hypothetical protein